jgi:hypothetical protein
VRDGRFLHARLRVPLGIAAFPAPSVCRAKGFRQTSGASRREPFARVWNKLSLRGALAMKQSSFLFAAPKLDCFANARNDDLKPSMTISDYLCSAV